MAADAIPCNGDSRRLTRLSGVSPYHFPEARRLVLEIMLLGTVEATMGGVSLRLAGERQKALIGKLALEKGKTVPTATLLGVLWGDSVPQTARTKLQGLVSAFRRMIRDQQVAGGDYLLTHGHGYELAADTVQVDIDVFDHLVLRARQAQQAGERETASQLLEQALGLWRGPALVDVCLPRIRGIAEAIDERRLLAVATKAEVDLALGRADAVAAGLSVWVNEYPLHERLRALLMQALYECGCRAGALRLYRAGRQMITTELGLEPSFELQRMHQRILAGDRPGGPNGVRVRTRM
jgi:DNA-binding SARP family transcriptional activator